MAKVAIKNAKITAFGGIYFRFGQVRRISRRCEKDCSFLNDGEVTHNISSDIEESNFSLHKACMPT